MKSVAAAIRPVYGNALVLPPVIEYGGRSGDYADARIADRCRKVPLDAGQDERFTRVWMVDSDYTSRRALITGRQPSAQATSEPLLR